MLNQSKNDPRRFWRTLKTNFSKIALTFCGFFTNMAVKVKGTSICLKDFVWYNPVQIHPKTYSTFHFKEVLVSNVFKHLKKQSNRLRRSTSWATPWTIYRLVKVLLVCSKVLKSASTHKFEVPWRKNILSETQFSLQKQGNTELAATLFLKRWGKIWTIVRWQVPYLSTFKAFDSLSHAQILENQPSYGIHGCEQHLFSHYLFNHKQAVRFNQELWVPECDLWCTPGVYFGTFFSY